MKNDALFDIFRKTAVEVLGISAEEAANYVDIAIAHIKAENQSIDVSEMLSDKQDVSRQLLPVLGEMKAREVDKFVAYAKEQGTKMPFEQMEQGILAAGRKDMQNGLAELLNSLSFTKPDCLECDEKTENRGRSKKKS